MTNCNARLRFTGNLLIIFNIDVTAMGQRRRGFAVEVILSKVRWAELGVDYVNMNKNPPNSALWH